MTRDEALKLMQATGVLRKGETKYELDMRFFGCCGRMREALDYVGPPFALWERGAIRPDGKYHVRVGQCEECGGIYPRSFHEFSE